MTTMLSRLDEANTASDLQTLGDSYRDRLIVSLAQDMVLVLNSCDSEPYPVAVAYVDHEMAEALRLLNLATVTDFFTAWEEVASNPASAARSTFTRPPS